jgi:hypothetical protein
MKTFVMMVLYAAIVGYFIAFMGMALGIAIIYIVMSIWERLKFWPFKFE